MKNLKIGKVYGFQYDCEFPMENQGDLCELKDESKKMLIEALTNASDRIQEKFKNMSHDVKQLKKLIDKLESEKKSLSKTDKAVLKNLIKQKKNWLFPKSKITDPAVRANNLFIRFYNPERMTIDDNSTLKAVYAGKKWTPKGNVVHKWYQLSPSKIKASYRVGCERYVKKLVKE
jgi:hypothetical protein